jgi:hypothetical protein
VVTVNDYLARRDAEEMGEDDEPEQVDRRQPEHGTADDAVIRRDILLERGAKHGP